MSDRFKAIVVREDGDGFRRVMEERRVEDLPEGEVLVRVHYSSLNYKDALSATVPRARQRAAELIDAGFETRRPGDGYGL